MNVCIEAKTLVEEMVDSDPPYLHVGMADAEGDQYIMFQRSQPFDDSEDWGVDVQCKLMFEWAR